MFQTLAKQKQIIHTITNTTSIIGSAHYLSPEQAKGTYIDFRTDIYSFGIVLYEMVTGKVPFSADTPVSVALKHMQEEMVFTQHLCQNHFMVQQVMVCIQIFHL